MVMTLIYEVKT